MEIVFDTEIPEWPENGLQNTPNQADPSLSTSQPWRAKMSNSRIQVPLEKGPRGKLAEATRGGARRVFKMNFSSFFISAPHGPSSSHNSRGRSAMEAVGHRQGCREWVRHKKIIEV